MRDAQDLVAMIVAVSFAAGLNVYATVGALGLLARTGILVLPPQLALLENDWVIGASLVLFAVEFLADKIPVFDLLWNAAQTLVRVPVAALLAWAAATPLTPGSQLAVTLAAAAIALVAHGGKFLARGAVTASPEPVSNILLSLGEDVVAIGLTWFAAKHPYLAAGIALCLLVLTVALLYWLWGIVGRSVAGLWQRLKRSGPLQA